MFFNAYAILPFLLGNVLVASTTANPIAPGIEGEQGFKRGNSSRDHVGAELPRAEHSTKNDSATPAIVSTLLKRSQGKGGVPTHVAAASLSFNQRRTLSGVLGWTQMGADIDGITEGEKFGSSVSMSRDGNSVAVGAPSTGKGRVRIYEWDGRNWLKVGNDILGEAIGDRFGSSVCMSRNGLRVVVGAPGNSAFGQDSGRASVYVRQHGTSAWVKMGDDFYGNKFDHLGESVSMSDDGQVIAIASGNNSIARPVLVYKWGGSSWNKMGKIDGHSRSRLVTGLSMDGNGKRIAVGTDSDTAHAFEWSGSSWEEIGQFSGGKGGETFGRNVALSRAGDRVAVQAAGGEGPEECFEGPYNHYVCDNPATLSYVRVFEQSDSTWEQIGDDIDPHGALTTGGSLSLSDDGQRVVIGTRHKAIGHAHIAEWNGSSWKQVGAELGEVMGVAFDGVSMSGDGERVVIAAPEIGDVGLVQVFKFDNNTSEPKATFPPDFNEVTCAFLSCVQDLRRKKIGVPPVFFVDERLDGIMLNVISNVTAAQRRIRREGNAMKSLDGLKIAMKWLDRVKWISSKQNDTKAVGLVKPIGDAGSKCGTDFVDKFILAYQDEVILDREIIHQATKRLSKAQQKRDGGYWEKSVQKSLEATRILMDALGEQYVPLC